MQLVAHVHAPTQIIYEAQQKRQQGGDESVGRQQPMDAVDAGKPDARQVDVCMCVCVCVCVRVRARQ